MKTIATKLLQPLLNKAEPEKMEFHNRPDITEFDDSRLKKLLEDHYWREGVAMSDIASRYSVSIAWVSIKMRELGIETRDTGGTKRLKKHGIGPESPEINYLDWLSPVQQEDISAVVLGSKSVNEQADERGVNPTTVSTNISKGFERLKQIHAQETREVTSA